MFWDGLVGEDLFWDGLVGEDFNALELKTLIESAKERGVQSSSPLQSHRAGFATDEGYLVAHSEASPRRGAAKLQRTIYACTSCTRIDRNSFWH